jgi:hypothetical protein
MRDKTPVCKVADMGLSKQKQQTFVTGARRSNQSFDFVWVSC